LTAFPTGRIITMADRYQDKPFPADDGYDRGDDQHAPARAESDPLAELARLIGQTDPFAMGRANQTVAPRSAARDQYQPPEPVDDAPAAGPPPWMQRAAVRQEVPPQEYPSAEHPLRRYATPVALPEPDYAPEPPYADVEEPDPSRYDEALYGQLATGEEQPHDAAYPNDAYAYQDGYEEGAEEPERKRGGGLMTVAVVLALAVLGTGAAFAYRTYIGSPRGGDAPIIKADTTPTKIVPAPDAAGKVPDRMAAGDGTEKIVPREEVPVDINAKPGPRVVFPPLNQSGNPQPPVASAAPAAAPPAVIPNGVQPGAEPRKIKTIPVAGDPLNGVATPVAAAPPAPARPAPVARAAAPRTPAAAPPAANAPLSLSPQAAEPAPAAEPPKTRMAAVTPAPAAAAPSGAGGGYLVQISSQRNEADAQASFRALQGKFPAVLGSRSPVIKRADLGDKGVYYRAMVGPFGSTEEAAQFCGSLKTAGGQCVVQRN
jgi:hypothetical protein